MGVQDWQRGPGKNTGAESRKSTVGSALKYMYKPHFGRSLGEIGQTSGMFVRLIAGAFVTQGLFPRQHPALKDTTLRLTLSEVISTSFHNLKWTKESWPQIAFFFAIIGTMIFSVIGFILMLSGVMATKAHAGLVDAPFPAADVGNKWLEHIFNNGDFTFFNPTTGNDYGMLAGDAVSTPLILKQIAVMYANVMLILAVIILIYHLVAMTVHTAHEGTVMGRNAHQIWAPVRLVFALGLLVPVADGWSSGQWIIMQIAKWGSGMASNIWQLTSNFPTPLIRMNPDTSGDNAIESLVAAGRCVVMNSYREGADGPAVINLPLGAAQGFFGTINAPGQGTDVLPIPAGVRTGFNPAGENFMVFAGQRNTAWWTGTACGVFYTPDIRAQMGGGAAGYGANGPDAGNLQRISTAYVAAFNAIKDAAFAFGVTDAILSNRTIGGGGVAFSETNTLANLRTQYRNAFVGAIGAGGPGIPGPGGFGYDPATNELLYKTADPYIADQRGWMSASMFFMDLVGMQSHAQRMIGLPVVGSMPLSSETDQHSYREGLIRNNTERNYEYQYQTLNVPHNLCGGSVANGANLDLVKKLIYCVGFIPLGLMDNDFNMTTGRQFAGTGNAVPFTDMVNFGGKLVNSGVNLIKLGLAFQAAQAAANLMKDATMDIATQASGEAKKILLAAGIKLEVVSGAMDMGAMLASPLISFGVLMLLPGFVLFYLLPALPFINFILGCITWIVSLMMATIAIPVIAIAHITPNGEGLPSASARGAYVMVLQIFLRPVMMIFGLYITILIANTGVVMASMLFTETTFPSMSGSDPLSQLIHFVLYAGLCYGIVNAAVTSIDEFPVKAVSWISGQSIDRTHDSQTSVAGMLAGQTVASQITGGLTGLRYAGMQGQARDYEEARMLNVDLAKLVGKGTIDGNQAAAFRNMGPEIAREQMKREGLNKHLDTPQQQGQIPQGKQS